MVAPAAAKGQNALHDPEERLRLKARIAEATHYLRQIDDYRDGLKESIASIADDYGLDKKLVRKMTNTMYKANYDTVQEETRHFEQMYEIVIEGKFRDDPEG